MRDDALDRAKLPYGAPRTADSVAPERYRSRLMGAIRNRSSRPLRVVTVMLLLAGLASCSDDDAAPVTTVPEEPVVAGEPADGGVVVLPDYNAPTLTVNVTFTDEGFEPEIVHMPAGRQIRLVLRNRGSREHHFRVVGMPVAEVRWLMVPEVDEEEQLAMEAESGFVDDAAHILHHLEPEFVPFKPASASGIRPLPGEVHGYAQNGTSDTLLFFPLETGVFTVEDVRYPEITGRVIVFDPDV
jgi:hypothetical protein